MYNDPNPLQHEPLSDFQDTTTPALPPPSPAAVFGARLRANTPNVFITYVLIALNVAVYLAMVLKGISPTDPTIPNLIQWGADFGPKTVLANEWWRLLTSTFLHIGIIHIAFNMYVLWQIGPFVERLLGNVGYLVTYLIAGLAGACVSVGWNPFVVSAGASGAIFGLYGALLGFIALRRDSIPQQVLSPLVRSALIFLGYNLVFGFARSGTDVAAHLGGLVGGFFCGLALSVPIAPESLPVRSRRNVAVAIAAAALLFGATRLLPRPFDIEGEMQTLGTVETKALADYNVSLTEFRKGSLSPQKFADAIETNVLRPWAVEHTRLAGLQGVPAKLQPVLSQTVQYMDLRQQGWSMLVTSLRTDDNNLAKQAEAKQKEAEAVLKQIGSN